VPETGSRAEASRKVREAIVAATVRIVAREGVAAVTHRRVAAEAGVALSSTTWHFAAKADILEAALRWSARQEVDRIGAIADRLGDGDFDPSAWAEELADWLVEQLTVEREIAVALYRLQIELLGSDSAREVHREWGEGLLAVGERALEHSATPTSHLDVRLIVAALDGLRMGALNSGDQELEWLRQAVRRQLQALLG
jgi:DNA-binding transcriptional regulator YbjK